MNQPANHPAASVCEPPNRSMSSTPATLLASCRRFFLQDSWQRWALMLFDQGVVSGTRFVATIIVGRAAGADDLGHYSVAFSVLVLLSCLQEALVTTPLAVNFHRLGRRARAAYAGGSLVLHAGVIGGIALLLFVAAGVNWLSGGNPGMVRLMLVVAATIPLSLMWEFARRSNLAQLHVASAAGIDCAASVLQIGGLLFLAATQRLHAASALATVATASLLVALTWLYRSRASREVRWNLVSRYWRRNWRLGRWLVASQMIGALHGMVPALLLALLAGASAAGVYAAHLNIALVAHPLILAVASLLTPRAAQALKVGGVDSAVRLIRNAALGMVGVLAVFVAALALGGKYIVTLVYGADFVGHTEVLVFLGSALNFWAIATACACGLTALRFPRGSFLATLGGTCASVLAILLLVRHWPVLGAAVGLWVGGLVAAALHVVLFTRHARQLAGPTRESQTHSLPQSRGESLVFDVQRVSEI